MPTLKQKKALIEIVEKGRTSISAVMRDVGYSEKTAVDPSKLTESKGFKELLDEYIPDEEVRQAIKDGLHANKIITSPTEPDTEYPDYANRHKYLSTVLNLKGYTEAPKGTTIVIPIYGGLSARPEDITLRGHNSDKKDLPAQAEN